MVHDFDSSYIRILMVVNLESICSLYLRFVFTIKQTSILLGQWSARVAEINHKSKAGAFYVKNSALSNSRRRRLLFNEEKELNNGEEFWYWVVVYRWHQLKCVCVIAKTWEKRLISDDGEWVDNMKNGCWLKANLANLQPIQVSRWLVCESETLSAPNWLFYH